MDLLKVKIAEARTQGKIWTEPYGVKMGSSSADGAGWGRMGLQTPTMYRSSFYILYFKLNVNQILKVLH